MTYEERVQQALTLDIILRELRLMPDPTATTGFFCGTLSDAERKRFIDSYDDYGIDVVNEIWDAYAATKK